MAVAFPSGYYIERSSKTDIDLGVQHDQLYDGTDLSQQRSSTEWHTFDCAIGALTLAEFNEILLFIRVNKMRSDITWTIDGIDYIGKIRGPVRRSFQGARYRIAFVYYAKEV